MDHHGDGPGSKYGGQLVTILPLEGRSRRWSRERSTRRRRRRRRRRRKSFKMLFSRTLWLPLHVPPPLYPTPLHLPAPMSVHFLFHTCHSRITRRLTPTSAHLGILIEQPTHSSCHQTFSAVWHTWDNGHCSPVYLHFHLYPAACFDLPLPNSSWKWCYHMIKDTCLKGQQITISGKGRKNLQIH